MLVHVEEKYFLKTQEGDEETYGKYPRRVGSSTDALDKRINRVWPVREQWRDAHVLEQYV